MVWWEAVLSPALQVLFDKLASGDLVSFLHKWNINDLLLEKLKIAYFANTAAIDDAEEKQYDNPSVETWLDMLKDAVYEAEDILDELATAAVRCKVEAGSYSTTNQIRPWSFISASFRPFGEGLDSRIKLIIGKLEYIAMQKDALGLKNDSGKRLSTRERTPTTPLPLESCVYGRDHDKEEIVKLLLSRDQSIKNGVCIIPIVGMGGIGKTTLAQIVYNDSRVMEFFDVRGWTCVSDNVNVINTTKAILESATKKAWDTMNLELLQEKLKRELTNKRFLVVLDDIWDVNYDEWSALSVPFLSAAPGSKVIVTTRNQGSLSFMNTHSPYRLKEISDDACWSFFLQHALGNRDSDAFPDLKAIGKEIIAKCKGLPLAVKTLGALLRSKLEFSHWNDVLYNNIWDLPPKSCNILPALSLSYHHLPANLKRCFAYCSIFPKDYEFDRKELVLLWMAEGFVPQVEESIEMEKIGEEYFNDLLLRSFFQPSTHNRSRYVMHDLIHDLAQYVSRKICIRLTDTCENCWQGNVHEKARHFSYFQSKYDACIKFEGLTERKNLRTFLPMVTMLEGGLCYLTSKVLKHLLLEMRCLRVLSLSGYCINELPASIDNLRHLRYLNLSHTAIQSLPESLCALCNLQSLLLNDCQYLGELPEDTGKLINLRHLNISRTGIQKMPLHMGRLRSLRTLSEFILGNARRSETDELSEFIRSGIDELSEFILANAGGSGIGELRDLVFLRGKLSILRLENVVTTWEARQANLVNKENLEELLLEWSSDVDVLEDETVSTTVLEMLQPNKKLKRISIKGYGGIMFPSWLGDPLFSNLVCLSFIDCKKCMSLPPLGQLPLLKRLYIKQMNKIRSIGRKFYGNNIAFVKPFQSLEILCFEEMFEWETWTIYHGEEQISGFPCLKELYVQRCPNLRGRLPRHLPSLSKLVIHESEKLLSPLPRLDSLRELDLRRSSNLLLTTASKLTSLASLPVGEMSGLTHLPEEFMRGLATLKNLQILDCWNLRTLWKNEVGLKHLTSLERLVTRNCPLLVSLLEEEQSLPRSLQYLDIESCQGLEKLMDTMQSLTSLRELTIKECQRFVSIPELPSTLKVLAIRGCGMDSLPEEVIFRNHAPLDCLYISGCYIFTSLPSKGNHPTTFRQLTIDHCPYLESLPEGMLHNNNTYLKVLEIFDCSSLEYFPEGELPATLKIIAIRHCPRLESLHEVKMQDDMSLESLQIGSCINLKSLPSGLHKIVVLDYLEIDECPSLVSLPQGGFPTSLKKLHITSCKNLMSLPGLMQNLSYLQELRLFDCPALVSFPEGGLPYNLVSLEMKDCENVNQLDEWGLHRLNSLKKFSIDGGFLSLTTFPIWLLPPTLTSLYLRRLINLETLSSWLQNLNSLEDLKIKDCEKLRSLPLDALPATLSRLEISGCPFLEQQCENERQKIDHIPCTLM